MMLMKSGQHREECQYNVTVALQQQLTRSVSFCAFVHSHRFNDLLGEMAVDQIDCFDGTDDDKAMRTVLRCDRCFEHDAADRNKGVR